MNAILLVEDSPSFLRLLHENMADGDRVVHVETDLESALNHLRSDAFDLVVADLQVRRNKQEKQIDKQAGIKILMEAKRQRTATQVILVTNYATPDDSQEAMQGGAFDFLDRNPSGIDFWAMLRFKVDLALSYYSLLVRHGSASDAASRS